MLTVIIVNYHLFICFSISVYCQHCRWFQTWAILFMSCHSVVCVLVTWVGPAKTAEPIEVPFGEQTHMGPRNCVLGGCIRVPSGKYDWMICVWQQCWLSHHYCNNLLHIILHYFQPCCCLVQTDQQCLHSSFVILGMCRVCISRYISCSFH